MADPTTITEATLKEAITERLKAVHVEVTDMSGGCGQSFTTLIVSSQFQGQTSLKRHRAVNAALRAEIAAIHAWSAKCQTPEEWERTRSSSSSSAAAPPMEGTVAGKVDGVDA
ncbi:bola domain-containing protein [Xylariaceae sp. FL0255]|nr:bola domain-containing protein [Xylariaceae sp. FL0255]